MGNENQLYSISLGVASLQGGLVGVATALSPATCRPFQVFSPSFFVGLELKIVTSFVLTRSEVRSGVDAKKAKPISEADRVRLAHYLQPNKHVIIDGDIRKLALEIVGNEQNPVLAARKLYDWMLENVEYWVKDPKNKKPSYVGSTSYCLTSRTGDCGDFDSLWTSFARSIGIPTQIVYGSFLKPALMGEDQ